MLRRNLLKGAAAVPLALTVAPVAAFAAQRRKRVRPAEPGWPGGAAWASLNYAVGSRLTKIASPWAAAAKAPESAETAALFKAVRNSFHNGENPAFTQSLGWTDAWTSKPSEYVVAVESPADVAAAVKFAQGAQFASGREGRRSQLPRRLQRARLAVDLDEADACDRAARQLCRRGLRRPERTRGQLRCAGCIWLEAYDAVTTKAGRYVQGGGCTTVGVAGLVQGGGFGSFSKGFGTGAANLLEAEVVTADGQVRIANASTNPDLFWALKGGGGGTFGVVTRLTLRTHELPSDFRRGECRDHRRHRRRLPRPGRADVELLPDEPLQSALGRADSISRRVGAWFSTWSFRA